MNRNASIIEVGRFTWNLLIRALRGAKFLTPPQIYPLSQTQIHAYPGILGENYLFSPLPATKVNSLNTSIRQNIMNLQYINALTLQ